jgi:hypothetical protein
MAQGVAMATILKKKLMREIPRKRGRPFVVTLYPEGTINIREKNLHVGFEVSLESVYMLAAKKAAEETVKERQVKKQVRRGLRR